MDKIKKGRKVKLRDIPDWPVPPGFRFAGAEGEVVSWIKFEETLKDFNEDYVCVRIQSAKREAQPYVGMKLMFRREDVYDVE